MDSHTSFIIIHLIGLAFGVGGVTSSHFYLHHIVEEPAAAEIYARMLPKFSLLIWFGVYLLGTSGLGLFLEQPEVYANSGKFLAKMVMVAVLMASGLYLSGPVTKKVLALSQRDWRERSEGFCQAMKVAIPGGVISIASWFGALILGAVGPQDWSMGQILSVYFYMILVGVMAGFLARDWLLSTGAAKRSPFRVHQAVTEEPN